MKSNAPPSNPLERGTTMRHRVPLWRGLGGGLHRCSIRLYQNVKMLILLLLAIIKYAEPAGLFK